ncbi:flavin reductase family protein [Saccharopolyspora gloriosae]|uniref:flavin reductase family protein n=1 Tax=Saccharopolyspora gloriosae TaxID=455344 RepID=UPI001FB5C7BB|nr:flavin reductase family protein [Saccharopolyspora gloriosae]
MSEPTSSITEEPGATGALSNTVDGSDLRSTMARFPTGVTITTTLDRDGAPWGFTAGSLVSVSLDPPLISVCVAFGARCYPAFAESGTFTVNVLRHDRAELARTFASKGVDKFAAAGFTRSATGMRLDEGTVAVLGCEVHGRHPAGDHLILVGLVRELERSSDDQLLFADQRFSRLAR